MTSQPPPLAGQMDLTDMVGVEHITGSMPADEIAREAARQAYYERLKDLREAVIARSELMDIIIEAENRLGAATATDKLNVPRARAIQHHLLTRAMARQNLTCSDLRLAISLCVRRRVFLNAPIQLVSFVEAARKLAADPDAVQTDIDRELEDAIAWENDQDDPEHLHWITRLGRAVGATRRQVLSEWREAGRG